MEIRNILLPVLLALLSILFFHVTAWSDDFNVSNTEEFLGAYIQANESNENDTINIAPGTNIVLTSGTFMVTLPNGMEREITIPTVDPAFGNTALPPVNGFLIINAGTQKSTIQVDQNSMENFRLFTVKDGSTLEVFNINLENGNADNDEALFGQRGGAILNFGSLGLLSVDITTSKAQSGGAVSNAGQYVHNGGQLRFNEAVRGGAIDNFVLELDKNNRQKGNAYIEANVTDNKANLGGGIFNSANITISQIRGSANTRRITNNEAETDGGGIYNDGGNIIIDNVNIQSNDANNDGAGIYNNKGKIHIRGSKISGNEAVFDGSGIFNTGGKVIIKKSELNDNTANEKGGSIINRDENVEQQSNAVTRGDGFNVDFTDVFVVIEDSEISGNSSLESGGGIANFERMTIRNTNIFNNTLISVEGTGGGIFNFSELDIEHSAIYDNDAPVGGGIFTEEGIFNISNSTVSGNTAGTGAGVVTSLGTDSFINTTITGNSVGPEGFGGGIFNFGADPMLTNTILADNTAGTGANCLNALETGGFVNGGNNISDDDTDDCAFAFNALFDPATMLGPLADNGGDTLTHALIEPEGFSNPAVDGGNEGVCLALPVNNLDQRFFIRNSPCDVGSFELGAEPGPVDETEGDLFVMMDIHDGGQGGEILVNLPDDMGAVRATVEPSIGNCVIPRPEEAGSGDNPAVECDFPEFPPTVELSMDLCTSVQPEEGVVEAVTGDATVRVISSENPQQEFEDIVTLIITTLQQCKESGGNGSGGGGCALAEQGQSGGSTALLLFIPALILIRRLYQKL